MPGNLSSVFSKASLVNHSHGLHSQTFKTLGALLIPRHLCRCSPWLHMGASWCTGTPFFLRDSLPEAEVTAGARRERCSQQLPFLCLSHKLFADSFLALVIPGIHHFQQKNQHLCRKRVLGSSYKPQITSVSSPELSSRSSPDDGKGKSPINYSCAFKSLLVNSHESPLLFARACWSSMLGLHCAGGRPPALENAQLQGLPGAPQLWGKQVSLQK